MVKQAGVWKVSTGCGVPITCTIEKLSPSGEGEHTIHHQSLDSLLDLRYLLSRAIGDIKDRS